MIGYLTAMCALPNQPSVVGISCQYKWEMFAERGEGKHSCRDVQLIDLVWFYGISTIVGYLMPNHIYTFY